MDYRKLYKEHYHIEFDNTYAVHHIDGNRDNNNISNLLLMPRDLHALWHDTLPKIERFQACKPRYTLAVYDYYTFPGYQAQRTEIETIWMAVCYWVEQKYIEDCGWIASAEYSKMRGKEEWARYEQKTL